MKKLFLLILIYIPLFSFGSFGYSWNDLSFLFGPQFRVGQKPLISLEIQFDKFSKSCTHFSNYKGASILYNFNNYQNEFGIKAFWNPSRYYLMLSRSMYFQPYLLSQISYSKTKTTNTYKTNFHNGYNLRPGIGFMGNFKIKKMINLKTFAQICHQIPLSPNNNNFWLFEIKLGLGINTNRLIKN